MLWLKEWILFNIQNIKYKDNCIQIKWDSKLEEIKVRRHNWMTSLLNRDNIELSQLVELSKRS